MNQSLKDKVAVVTGAASGIGRATALRFAKEGAKVALLDIQQDKAKEVGREIEDLGGEALVITTNVADPDSIKETMDLIAQSWNKIDIVFANAGINGKVTTIEDMTPEDWDKTLNINLKSTFLTVKYAIPHMKENGGSIVITSSINGNREFSNFGFSAYSSSKAGQMAFGKMAALELSKYNIRVNVVCPGAIDTNIQKRTYKEEAELEEVKIPIKYPEGSHPLEGKPGKPEQVADLVLFLASDASSHITGTEVYIDGAETLL